jgi:hypothetical protein
MERVSGGRARGNREGSMFRSWEVEHRMLKVGRFRISGSGLRSTFGSRISGFSTCSGRSLSPSPGGARPRAHSPSDRRIVRHPHDVFPGIAGSDVQCHRACIVDLGVPDPISDPSVNLRVPVKEGEAAGAVVVIGGEIDDLRLGGVCPRALDRKSRVVDAVRSETNRGNGERCPFDKPRSFPNQSGAGFMPLT